MAGFTEKLLNAPVALTFDDVILLPGWSDVEPREVSLRTRVSKNVAINIPLVSSPMDTVTEHAMAAIVAKMGGIGVVHRNMSVEEQVREVLKVKEEDPRGPNPALDEEGRLLVGAAVSPHDIERAVKLDRYVDVLVADVAHFHTARVFESARRLLKSIGSDFIAGNIGTYEAAEDVVTKLDGVAGLRVGISSGSICSTGEVVGVAAPTLYSVAQVADALRDYGVELPIIADGGIRSPGDAAKALAAGASAVMLGFVLAGTDEAPGDIIVVNGVKYKEYRGMASQAARARIYARDRYPEKPSKDIAEGIEGLVPYKGAAANVIAEFVAGLQAAMGYTGSRSIRELWEKAVFARLTPSGLREVRPHSVIPINRRR